MENKICLINQPAGLGDIFFIQKIVQDFINKGYNVIYPVLSQLLYIKDYIKTPNLEFVGVDDMFPYRSIYGKYNIVEMSDLIYLPITFANSKFGGCIMRAKYRMVDLDHSDWVESFNFVRNIEKENHLFYNILNLKDGEEYNFVNRTYGTPPHSATKHEVQPLNDLKNIENKYYDGINIFDWCKVIENATNIYTIDTSFLFIMEKLNLKASNNKLEMWSRHSHYEYVDGLFKTKWNYN
jgi:hypothetical protein